MRHSRAVLVLVLAATAVAATSAAETMEFKVLAKGSQATFRSDAPLETIVGTAAL
jgi:hypothetical protein